MILEEIPKKTSFVLPVPLYVFLIVSSAIVELEVNSYPLLEYGLKPKASPNRLVKEKPNAK